MSHLSYPQAVLPPTVLDWHALAEIEPQLASLELAITCSTPPSHMDGFWRTWESWKQVIQSFAGWEAHLPELRTEAAYNAAYDHLWRCYEDAALQNASNGLEEHRS